MIYGYNIDENLDNQSIGHLERTKLKTKQYTQNPNMKKAKSDNDFSKLIALASLFSAGDLMIKVTRLDKMFETSIKLNEYFQTIVNELGMCQIYEISPLNFVEWVQKKKLILDAAKAYDVFMSKGMF